MGYFLLEKIILGTSSPWGCQVVVRTMLASRWSTQFGHGCVGAFGRRAVSGSPSVVEFPFYFSKRKGTERRIFRTFMFLSKERGVH